MKRILFETFLGILLTFSGIYSVYFILTGLEKGISAWLLLGSIVLLAGGAYCFIHASKAEDKVLIKPLESDANMPDASGAHGILKKNNELSADYKKISNARDRLKILQAASDK